MTQPALRSVSAELPDPPYPADTITKGWRFELDMQRIRRSDTWVLCPREMRPWLLMIWATAFEQAPAGSLPTDHAIIAAHVDMEPRTFSANADILLRGFARHSDGRIYHPVVVERVKQICGYRDLARERKAKYRNKLKSKETCPVGQTRDGRGKDAGRTLLELELELEQEQKEPTVPDLSSKGQRGPNGPMSGKTKKGTIQKPPWDDVQKVLDDLNYQAGSNFKLKNRDGKYSANAQLIRSRLNQHSLGEILAVTTTKAVEWGGDDKMRKFLRPSTLYNATKFEQYLGQLETPIDREYGSFLDDAPNHEPLETTWSHADG